MSQAKHEFVMLILPEASDDSEIYKICSDPVWCKLPYTPPYSEFTGLKDIQLNVRAYDVYERIPMCLVIDISEWKHHENEDYFISALRFFYDQRYRWKYIFTVKGTLDQASKNIYASLRRYLCGCLKYDSKWLDKKLMSDYLRSKGFEHAAAAAFSDLILSKEFELCRSVSFVDNICSELRRVNGAKKTIGLDDFICFISNPDSTMALISAKCCERVKDKYAKGVIGVDEQ